MRKNINRRLIAMVFTLTMVFQLSVSAIGVTKSQSSNETKSYSTNVLYKDIFRFQLVRPDTLFGFEFTYTLDENNVGTFGVNGRYGDYGYLWDDTYEVEVLDSYNGLKKASATLKEGEPAYPTIQKFVDQLNENPSKAGDRIVFKSSKIGTMSLNRKNINKTKKDLIIGYKNLYSYSYQTTLDFKSREINSQISDEYFGITAAVSDTGKVEFYSRSNNSQNYIFDDQYEVTKIDKDGIKVSSTLLPKGSNINDGIEILVQNMNKGSDLVPTEIMIENKEQDHSVKINGMQNEPKLNYLTFNDVKLVDQSFMTEIGLKISNANSSENLNFFATQGNLGNLRFGLYGIYDTSKNFTWDDTYNFVVKSTNGTIKANVNLVEGDLIKDQVSVFPDGMNQHSIKIGDLITISSTKPNTVTVGDTLVETTESTYEFTEYGFVIKN